MDEALGLFLTLLTLAIMATMAFTEAFENTGPAWGFFLGIVWQNLCLSLLKKEDKNGH
jgi:hypothetical protein